MSRKRKCTVFEAFKVLQDGDWHSDNELMSIMGSSATRRVRELREPPYGEFDIGIQRAEEIGKDEEDGAMWYRLPIEDCRKDKHLRKAWLELSQGRVPFPELKGQAAQKRVDQEKLPLTLTIKELVYLHAIMTDDSQLRRPQCQQEMIQVREILRIKLWEAMPTGINRPNDLYYETAKLRDL